MKILIIDDDALVRMTMKNVLKKLEYTVFEAEDGNKGLEIYQKEKPDIVITDMLMPEKEGLQTLSEIKALNPKAKIIAMSAGGNLKNMSYLQVAKKMGADGILSKPVTPDELVAIIKRLSSS